MPGGGYCSRCWSTRTIAIVIKNENRLATTLAINGVFKLWFILARKKHSPSPPKRYWSDNSTSGQQGGGGGINQALIDPTNIENISANINRADLLAAASHKLAHDAAAYYSSDESNDSLVIDQDN